MDEYIQKFARKNSQEGVSQTHVLFDDTNKKIISYYSTCNYSITKKSLLPFFKFPVKQIPASLIGRLAVDKAFQKKGYGELTLIEALKQIRGISKVTGIKIVIVDALNSSAVSFYKNFGFIELLDEPTRLFIKTSDIEDL